MSDLISTQELVAKFVDTAIRKILRGEQKLTKEYEQSVIEAVDEILNTARRERGKAEARPKIVRCKDCKWKQGSECVRFADVRPHPDDFCSKAERRTDGV